jgi:hypothetical protein
MLTIHYRVLLVRNTKHIKGVMDGANTTTNWIIAGLVALAVIIGGGWLIAREKAGSVSGKASTSTAVTTQTDTSDTGSTENIKTGGDVTTPTVRTNDMTASAAGETITVLDQPAGPNAIVAEVTLTKPSWVVIRDTRGWALGAAWFSESQKSIVVPLLRNTETGKTYEAVIYTDDGDKKFSLHASDMLVTGTAGAPVSSTFTAK